MKLLFPSKNRPKLHYLQLKVEKFSGGAYPRTPLESGVASPPQEAAWEKKSHSLGWLQLGISADKVEI